MFTLLAVTGIAYACGPFFNYYIYMPEDSDTYHPLQDADTLFTSKYGLILSNWGPEYLYPIYMDLVGRKISEETKEKIVHYYAGSEPTSIYAESYKGSIGQWLDARKLILSEDKKIDELASTVDGYTYYVNCNPNAFEKAKETLEQRKQIYNQDQMVSWVKRQDDVFSKCGGVSAKDVILPDHSSFLSVITDTFLKIKYLLSERLTAGRPAKQLTADELFEYDKEYQEAAIDFYQDKFEDAERKFRKIADNPDQPWRGYALLVIGRIYIRMAELGTVKKYDASDRPEDIKKAQIIRDKLYANAERQFSKILADSTMSTVFDGARDLQNYVLFRIDPKRRLKIAEDALQTPGDPGATVSNLEDYSLLWSSRVRNKKDEPAQKDWKDYILRDGGDLSQWIFIWKYGTDNSLKYSLDKYHKEKSIPWLLASLKYITPGNPSFDEIMRAAENLSMDSSGYFTANYYKVKLLIASGSIEDAKKEIEKVLTAAKQADNPIVESYFNELYMSIAGSFDDVLSHSLRNIVYVESDSSLYGYFFDYKKPEKSVALLDRNLIGAFNKFVPLNMWMNIIFDNTALTPEIRKHIGLIAFVRAVLLEDWKSAQIIVDFLASDSTLRKDLASFRTATTDEERKFASSLFMLDYAGIGNSIDDRFEDTLAGDFSVKEIDNYRRNWWCSGDPIKSLTPVNGTVLSAESVIDGEKNIKKLFSEEDITWAKTENSKIYSIMAPNYLSSVIIEYANNHRNDQRAPRALHMAVVSTRVPMCADKETTQYSKRAFQTLHNNYPNNYWTKETPYWY